MEDQEKAAPVVVEETEQTEDTAPSTDAETKEAEPKAQEPKRNRRTFQKRIDQLTAELRDTQRRLTEKSQPEITTKEPAAPKREDFADYEEYIEAKAEHKATQAAGKAIDEARKAQRQEHETAQESQQQRAFMEARETTLDRGVEAYEDFEAVTTNEDLTITPVMADALLSSDKGHDLWYHLGKHPEVAEKIANMHPVQQLMELGRLEASLAVAKKTSAAPKPTEVVQGRGSFNNALNDKLSTKEWIKRRNEEVRKSSI
jgi:hypothetical protein